MGKGPALKGYTEGGRVCGGRAVDRGCVLCLVPCACGDVQQVDLWSCIVLSMQVVAKFTDDDDWVVRKVERPPCAVARELCMSLVLPCQLSCQTCPRHSTQSLRPRDTGCC